MISVHLLPALFPTGNSCKVYNGLDSGSFRVCYATGFNGCATQLLMPGKQSCFRARGLETQGLGDSKGRLRLSLDGMCFSGSWFSCRPLPIRTQLAGCKRTGEAKAVPVF